MLVTFGKIYLDAIWYGKSLSSKLDVTMASIFLAGFFQNS